MADNQTPKRPNYFKSQYLELRDFQDEQNYHIDMLRRHTRGLHGWGAVRGGLQITSSADKKSLLITPGSAIDNQGREIVLDGAGVLLFQNNDRRLNWNDAAKAYELSAKDVSAAAGVTGTPLDVYLTLTFQESKSDDPNDLYPPPGGTVDVTRWRQTPLLKVEQTPPDDGSSIKLARVNVDVGGNVGAPDMSVRPQMGCIGPLSLTSADGKPQFGIDYDSQSDALRVRARTKDAPVLDATHLTIKRDTGNVGIGANPPQSNLHLKVPISASPVSAMSIDVQSFNTVPNAQASHFFRVRDIGANSTPFYIRGDGKVGIGTIAPLGPLSIGDASIDGSDGYIVVGRKLGNTTRQYRIGLDFSSNFVIGDYGSGNVAGSWNSQFAINWSAPKNSLYIDSSGKVGLGTDIPKATLDVSGGGIKIGAASDVVPAAGKELVLSPISGTSAGIVFQHKNVDTVFLKSDSSTRQTTFGATEGTFLAIDNVSGKVGIGATDITHQLTIENKKAEATMRLKSSVGGGNYGLLISSAQNGASLATAQPLGLNSGATGIKLLATGNIGIGTGSTDPTERLDVRSSGPDVAMNLKVANSDATNFLSFYPGRTSDQNPAIMWRTGKPLRFATADKVENSAATGFAERVRITGDGKVGIGTPTPGFPLTFADAAGDKISLWGQSGNNYGFGIQSGLFQIHTDTPGADIAFGYGSSASFTETMRIKGSGKVGIGANPPQSNLHLNVPASSQPISAMSIDVASFKTHSNAADSHFFRVRDVGSSETHFYIRGDGKVGLGTTEPGVKLEVAGDVKVTGKITIGDWALESRTNEQFGKGALFIMYKGADVARFGAKQDMFQVFKLNDNGQRMDKRYWYINKDEGINWGTAP